MPSPSSSMFRFHRRTPSLCIVSGHQRDPKHAFYEKREWNGSDLNRQPLEWQSSMLTARPRHSPLTLSLLLLYNVYFYYVSLGDFKFNPQLCNKISKKVHTIASLGKLFNGEKCSSVFDPLFDVKLNQI